MDSIENPIENMLLNTPFLVKNMDRLGQGMIIFSLLWFSLYLVRGFLQYRLAKATDHKQPWIAFFPLLNLFQWFQMGSVSLWWGLLFFIPGIVNIFSIPGAVLSLLAVFITFGVLFLRASCGIVKKKQQSFLQGVLLSLPLVRFAMMHWVEKKDIWINKITNRWAQLCLIIMALGVSWGAYLFIFYLFGWMAFGELFIPFIDYLSNPSITPQNIINEVLTGTSF